MKYPVELHNRLTTFEVPRCLSCLDTSCLDPAHSEDRDSHVLDILTALVETSYSCIPLSRGKTRPGDPKKSCPVSRAVPGWKEEVEPLRQESLFWHSVWISAGRPFNGLHETMKQSRYRYHHSIRQVKKKAGEIKAKKLLEASEKGNIELLEEMKRVKGGKRTVLDRPENVAGASGEKNIVEKFREFYEGVYNSSESNEAVMEIKVKLRAVMNEEKGREDAVTEVCK